MSSKRGFAKGRKRATDEYKSDDFVIDDDEAPKGKKSKTTSKAKKGGSSANGMLTDDNGDQYWEVRAEGRSHSGSAFDRQNADFAHSFPLCVA